MSQSEKENNEVEVKIIDGDDSERSNGSADGEDASIGNESPENGAAINVEILKNKLQQLQAEFENYKKRNESERLLLVDIIKSEMIKKLLPILDDFDRLFDHEENESGEFREGVKLIHKQFYDLLKEQGLKPIGALGKKFDPNFHEALLTDYVEDIEEDMITAEWRKGYLFKERLLRPTQVKVNKKNS